MHALWAIAETGGACIELERAKGTALTQTMMYPQNSVVRVLKATIGISISWRQNAIFSGVLVTLEV